MTSSATVPLPVTRVIRQYRLHKALRGGASWLCGGGLVALALFLAGVRADRATELPLWVRVAAPILGGVALLAGVIGALMAVARTFDQEANASEIDLAVPGSRDLLRSTLNFLAREGVGQPHPVHPFMLASTHQHASELAARIRPTRILGWRNLPALAAGLIVLAGATAALTTWPAMQMSLLIQRFFNPMGNYPRPSLIHINVSTPLHQRVAEGADIPVTVTLSGVTPADTACTLNLLSNKSREAIPMNPRPGGRFELTLRSVDAGLAFFITAGDGKSARYDIDVDPLPRISNMVAHFAYPTYTRLPKADEPVKYGEIRAVEGTRVRVDFEASSVAADSAVVFPDHKLKIRWDPKGLKGSFELMAEHTSPFFIHLVDKAGVDNRESAAYRLRVIPDNPPVVSLLNVPDSLTFYRDELFHVGYHGTDDFGISEIFVRSSVPKQAFRGTKEMAIPFEGANPKEVSGELQLELADMTEGNDTELQLQLIMVDTKGQEAASQRLGLTIISDTPERMLAELIATQDRFHGQVARAFQLLNIASGQLGLLVDGMDDSTKIEAQRNGILRDISRDLTTIQITNVATDLADYRTFAFSEYPEPEMSQTQLCMADAVALLPGTFYAGRFESIHAQASPKQELVRLKAIVDQQKAQAKALAEGFRGVILQTRLDLLQILIDQYLDTREKLNTGAGLGEAAAAFREKQDQRLQSIARIFKELQPQLQASGDADAEFKSAVDTLIIALSAQGTPADRDRASADGLRDMQTSLRTGPALDGHLGRGVKEMEDAQPLAKQLERAGDPAALEAARASIGARLRLRRSIPEANAAELLVAARLYEAALTGDPKKIAGATAWAGTTEPWVQSYGAVNRLLTLRTRIRELNTDLALGRLTPEGVRFDQAWQTLREAYLSLVLNHRAGFFGALDSQTQADLSRLAEFRPAFEPMSGIAAYRQPQLKAALESMGPIIDQAANRLWPAAEEGSRQAAAQTQAIVQDLAANFRTEPAALVAERKAIDAEVAAAPKNDGGSSGKPVVGRTAKPERFAFTVAMQDRIACHAASLGQVLDIRERLWTQNPDAGSRRELAALSVLFEYFSHLEEDYYDKSVAAHIQAVYFKNQVYPGYIESIGSYFERLGPELTQIGGWAAQAGEGKGADLLTIDEYTQLLAHVNKATRYDEAEGSMKKHAEFMAGYAAAHSPADRKTMLNTIANMPVHGSVYWERVYGLLDSLSTDAEQALKPHAGTAWAGVPGDIAQRMAAKAKMIAFILPDTKPVSDEAKQAAEAMAALPGLLERSQVDKVATLSPADRELAHDDLATWQGETIAAMRGVESKTAEPAAPTKPRGRLVSKVRYDLERIRSRLMSNEMRWTDRARAAVRRTWGGRADALLAADDDAMQRRNAGWLAAEEGSTRRKSATALAQRNRALGLEGEPDDQYLKMPRHLYDELMRGSAKPPPEQFKDPALKYMEGLLKDSR